MLSVKVSGQISQSKDSVCFSIKEANRIDYKFLFYKKEIKSLETALFEKIAETTGIIRLKNEWKKRSLNCESMLVESNNMLIKERSLSINKDKLIDIQAKEIKSFKRLKIKAFIRGIQVGVVVSGIIVGVIYITK